MKRFLSLFLVVLNLCILFVSCDKKHEHVFSETWKSNTACHWHDCACGATQDVGTHDYSSDGNCKICKGSIFAGEFISVPFDQAYDFSENLTSAGKKFVFSSGYQINLKTELQGVQVSEGAKTTFKQELIWNVFVSENETGLIAYATCNSARTYDGGLLSDVLQYEAWYQGSYVFTQEKNVLNNETVKYKEQKTFDEFLYEYIRLSESMFDMTMMMQVFNGGFYHDIRASYCNDVGYEKYRIDVPAQTKENVTNELSVSFVFDEETRLISSKYYSVMKVELSDSLPEGEGISETINTVIIVPYSGGVNSLSDPGSFPDKAA